MSDKERKSLLTQIDKILDKVRPYLHQDGGDVELVDINDQMIVQVKLQGACRNCVHNVQTLKSGIEMTLKAEMPSIQSVENVA